jgi:UDP-glucose 4-epimerase
MRVLVTGGSGFIGSHVVDRLLAAGIEPRIFDIRRSPHHDPAKVDTVLGTLFDTQAVGEAMEGCDAVIHLAGAADVGVVVEQPSSAEATNARGTLSVLEAARSTGVARVIYASTIWVYGESGKGVLDEDTPLMLPRHIYTASKLAGEMYCTSYAELYGLSCTILRFGIPYGPRARPSAVIPIFVRKAMAGEPLTIAGDGKQTRRFIYVEDLAEGVVLALDPCAVNRVYNLAGDETVTIRGLAEAVQEQVGGVEIVHVPGRDGDFGGAEISSRRVERDLGWRAGTRLHEGLARYLAWLGERSVVAAPKVAPAEPAAPRAIGAAAPVPRPMAERMPASVAIMTFACVATTLLFYWLAHRMDEFDPAQADAVGVTTSFAIVACLVLGQAVSLRNTRHGVMTVGWLVIGYFALLTLPWPIATPPIALPEIQTLIMSAVGTSIALALVGGAGGFREVQAAPDRLT